MCNLVKEDATHVLMCRHIKAHSQLKKAIEEFSGNGGDIKFNKTAELLGVGRFPFSTEAKTNLFGMFQMIELGYRIYMDSEIDNKIYVEKDNQVRVFIPSKDGLYFYDIEDPSLFYEKNKKQK